jgi:tubulin polyglutamylase TTLL2
LIHCCKWTLTQLRHFFHQNHINDNILWIRILNIVILTVLIQAPQVPKCSNCFELYGFDILIDENLKPWLLEVNFSPSLGADCQVDMLVKKPLLHDIIQLMNFKDEHSFAFGFLLISSVSCSMYDADSLSLTVDCLLKLLKFL